MAIWLPSELKLTPLLCHIIIISFFVIRMFKIWSLSKFDIYNIVAVVVQTLSHVHLFVTPLTAAHQLSLSITIFLSLLKLMSIESMMPSIHLILCHPLLLLPPIAICSDFRAQENKICHCFHISPFYLPRSDGIGCIDLHFLNVEFQASFFTHLFHFYQEAL